MKEELEKNNNEQHRDATTTRIRMNAANLNFHRSHSTPPNQTTSINNHQNNDENNAIRNNNNETASAVILLGISTGAARLSAYSRSPSDSRDGLREGLQISSTVNNLDDAPVSLLYDDCYDDSDKENIDPLQTKVIKARRPARPMCTFNDSDDENEEDGFVQVLMPLGQKKKLQLNNKSGGSVSTTASITVNNGQDDVLVEKKCNRLDNVKRRGDHRHGTINSKKIGHSMIKSTEKKDDLKSKTSATSSNVSRTKTMRASHNKKMTSNDLQQVDKVLQPLMNSLSLKEQRRFNH